LPHASLDSSDTEKVKMLKFMFIVFAIAGVIETIALLGHAASGERQENEIGTSDGENNETANSTSKSNGSPLRWSSRLGPHYTTWWTLTGDHSPAIQAMGKIIQAVQYPVEKISDEELDQLERLPVLGHASDIFYPSTWENSSSMFVQPIMFCIGGHIDNYGQSYYTNSIVPSKDVKNVCEFLGKAQIVPTNSLRTYVDHILESNAGASFKDTFMFACADCVRDWSRYNFDRPPRPHN